MPANYYIFFTNTRQGLLSLLSAKGRVPTVALGGFLTLVIESSSFFDLTSRSSTQLITIQMFLDEKNSHLHQLDCLFDKLKTDRKIGIEILKYSRQTGNVNCTLQSRL